MSVRFLAALAFGVLSVSVLLLPDGGLARISDAYPGVGQQALLPLISNPVAPTPTPIPVPPTLVPPPPTWTPVPSIPTSTATTAPPEPTVTTVLPTVTPTPRPACTYQGGQTHYTIYPSIAGTGGDVGFYWNASAGDRIQLVFMGIWGGDRILNVAVYSRGNTSMFNQNYGPYDVMTFPAPFSDQFSVWIHNSYWSVTKDFIVSVYTCAADGSASTGSVVVITPSVTVGTPTPSTHSIKAR